MTPEQFWRAQPREIWWLIAARRPRPMFGRMSEDEVESLYAETFDDG